MKIKNFFSALFGNSRSTEVKLDSMPKDIVEKVGENFSDEADRSYVLQRLETLWQMPLNVGPTQLARGILILSGNDRNAFEALFKEDFMGDPRDLLATAEAKLGNPGHYGLAPFESSLNLLKHQVTELIAEGKIPEAIQVLLDAGHTDAALLKARWNTLMLRQQTDEKLDWETFTITQNHITFALMEMSKSPETHTAQAAPEPESPNSEPGQSEYPKLTEAQCTQLLHLVQKDQWLEALQTGKDWSAEIMLLHSRMQRIEKQYHLGLVLETTYGTELDRIKQALAFLLQNRNV